MVLFSSEQFGRGATQRRSQTEKKARQDRYTKREEQHANVDPGLFQPRNSFRCNGDKETKQELGEPAAREATQHSQEQAFRECLADQASARSTNGGADSQLPRAAGSPREEQICNVGTRDKQHRQNRAQK